VNLVVIGDTLLDVDVIGAAHRLSPDAPVPVLEVQSTSERAGGAGLVARMLQQDGMPVRLVTALGQDAPAARLLAALEGIDVIAGPSGAPTAVKTRLSAGGQLVVRVDEGTGPTPTPTATPAMVQAIRDADILIVSDYGRGVAAAPEVRSALERRRRVVPLIWDPHPRGAAPVTSSTVVTPNLNEAMKAAGVSAGASPVSIATDAGAALVKRWGCFSVAVTMGPVGALYTSRDSTAPVLVPAPQVDVDDACGAGDRLVASLGAGLFRHRSLLDALRAAVSEASAFLAGGGVAALAKPPRPAVLDGPATDAFRLARQVRQAGGTVVATGGCFDLLHAGHAKTLAAARALGDCLVVCLNSDSSVRALKGPSRPIMSEKDRVELLLALECVDAVLVFDEETPVEALQRLEPHLWVKGGDYDAEELPESELVRSWGGRTVILPYIPGHSTTALATARGEAARRSNRA
jgi:D-beta-D-heptose 7-phosphate kinase/D-beta-D-heptose 1-phosphate adenosyltransferase